MARVIVFGMSGCKTELGGVEHDDEWVEFLHVKKKNESSIGRKRKAMQDEKSGIERVSLGNVRNLFRSLLLHNDSRLHLQNIHRKENMQSAR